MVIRHIKDTEFLRTFLHELTTKGIDIKKEGYLQEKYSS
jgi:hypothetical protein